jgi:hypothetical protein
VLCGALEPSALRGNLGNLHGKRLWTLLDKDFEPGRQKIMCGSGPVFHHCLITCIV